MTTTVAPCTSCQGGDLRGLERTRFFPRQLVTPDDLTQDQVYFREKSKRHNRMLHGWGVVCGACVRRGATPCEVIVEPGYVLGPFGDEIVIDRDVVVDVCKLGTGELDGCCGEELDPWCSDAKADCSAGTYYLAVKYSDCMSRPVRGGGGCGCGCDDHDCEYSRIRDSFSFKLLRELPQGYTTPMQGPGAASINPCARPNVARACPPCPTDPWVILADVLVDASCNVRGVNCFTHRRYVMSFAQYFIVCQSNAAPNTGAGINIAGTFAGATLTNPSMFAMMGTMSGPANLVDTDASLSGASPRAMVSLMRADGSTAMLPAFFAVERGSTVGDLLEREGDRTFFDPAVDRTYTLREIYRAAGVPASARLEGTASALSLLEGKTLGASAAPAQPATDAPSTREHLRDTIDAATLAELPHDADVATLPATTLACVSETSALGKRLARLTIGEVGAMSRDELLTHATKEVSARQRKQVERQAEEIWRNARRATSAYAPEPEDDEG